MLTGVNFQQAIKYWTQGREVIVIDRSSANTSGGYDNFPFEDLFRNLELLADVPAVENPDFSQTLLTEENANHDRAVAAMVHGSDQKPEEPTGRESNTPPDGAGGE